LTIVDDLLRRKIRVIFTLQGLDLRDLDNLTTKLTLYIFSMMAKHERSVISQRTKETLRVLKEKGIRIGRPKNSLNKYSIFDRHLSKIKEWCRFGFPYSRQARALKMSSTDLRHYVRSRGIYRGPGLR